MRAFYGIALAMVVYVAGLLSRLLMLWQIKGSGEYFFNAEPVGILTPDAGLYGYYATKILAETVYPYNNEYMLGHLIAFVVGNFGLSMSWTMFLLPAFLSPLAGVMLFLFLTVIGKMKEGFFASLIFIFGFSYYSRTLLGFTDTDILNLFFPLGILLGALLVFRKKDARYAVVSAIFAFAYAHWYHSYAPILYGILAFLLGYILVFERKNFYAYLLLPTILAVSVPLNFYLQWLFILSIVLLGNVAKNIKINFKIVLLMLFLLVVCVLIFFDLGFVYDRFMDYIEKTGLINFSSPYGNLNFVDTLQFVDEAGTYGYFYSYRTIIGSILIAAFGLAGYVWLCVKDRLLILLFPLLLIGALAPIAGLRFANYAAPVIAVGVSAGVFGFFGIGFIHQYKKLHALPYYILTAILGLTVLWIFLFNRTYARDYFNARTMAATKELQKVYRPNDYVVAWWDYGWPLWYYGFKNTIIDNGKHFKDNYWVSKLLISNDQNFTANTALFVSEKMQEAKQKGIYQASDIILNEKDISMTLSELKTTVPQTPSVNSVFLYLPNDMLLRLYNIAQFGNIDPKTAKPIIEKWRYGAYKVSHYDGQKIIGGDANTGTFDFDIETGAMLYNGKKKQAKTYTEVNHTGAVLKRKDYNSDTPYNVVKFENYLMIMDKDALNCFVIQSIVFNNYDKNLFKEVYRGANTLILQVLK